MGEPRAPAACMPRTGPRGNLCTPQSPRLGVLSPRWDLASPQPPFSGVPFLLFSEGSHLRGSEHPESQTLDSKSRAHAQDPLFGHG